MLFQILNTISDKNYHLLRELHKLKVKEHLRVFLEHFFDGPFRNVPDEKVAVAGTRQHVVAVGAAENRQ